MHNRKAVKFVQCAQDLAFDVQGLGQGHRAGAEAMGESFALELAWVGVAID